MGIFLPALAEHVWNGARIGIHFFSSLPFFIPRTMERSQPSSGSFPVLDLTFQELGVEREVSFKQVYAGVGLSLITTPESCYTFIRNTHHFLKSTLRSGILYNLPSTELPYSCQEVFWKASLLRWTSLILSHVAHIPGHWNTMSALSQCILPLHRLLPRIGPTTHPVYFLGMSQTSG